MCRQVLRVAIMVHPLQSRGDLAQGRHILTRLVTIDESACQRVADPHNHDVPDRRGHAGHTLFRNGHPVGQDDQAGRAGAPFPRSLRGKFQSGEEVGLAGSESEIRGCVLQ